MHVQSQRTKCRKMLVRDYYYYYKVSYHFHINRWTGRRNKLATVGLMKIMRAIRRHCEVNHIIIHNGRRTASHRLDPLWIKVILTKIRMLRKMAHCVALPGFVEDTLVIRRYAIERLFARITVESYQRARARRITLFARAYQGRIQKFPNSRKNGPKKLQRERTPFPHNALCPKNLCPVFLVIS